MTLEHRRESRSQIFLDVVLRLPDGDIEVRLTNLSSIGARADYPILLAPGTSVQILRDDLRLPGRIAWAVAGKIGVEFTDPLSFGRIQCRSAGHS